ncbi:Cytochrome c6 [Nymphaea thermarum]|nr:Cytochrome c6 [Nymphaea thermarum]
MGRRALRKPWLFLLWQQSLRSPLSAALQLHWDKQLRSKKEQLFSERPALDAMMAVGIYCNLNGMSTEESIYEITYYGNGRMPGFGEKCTPRGQCTFGARLQDDEIKLLAMFVKSQAEQGWPNIEIYKD